MPFAPSSIYFYPLLSIFIQPGLTFAALLATKVCFRWRHGAGSSPARWRISRFLSDILFVVTNWVPSSPVIPTSNL